MAVSARSSRATDYLQRCSFNSPPGCKFIARLLNRQRRGFLCGCALDLTFFLLALSGPVTKLSESDTDEIGYHAVEKPVHVHDLHATILHLMGLDHTRLTYRSQGREFRLTDVHGHLVRDLLA